MLRRLARWRVPLGFLAAVAAFGLARPTWRSLTAGLMVALPGEALRIWAAAAKRAGSLDKKAIRDQIAATRDYEGVAGTITMGSDRNPIKPLAMIKIENGQMNFAGWVQP